VLVGLDTHDDAGIFLVNEDHAIIQTVDFFTPIVDDPYDYGQIAAANSLSDIYAMGGTPVTALNIVGFPDTVLDMEILAKIITGGFEKAREAGVTILGGHSVKDPELKFGMAVTGTISPDEIIRNNTARPGDALILTKPLGTGILTTTLKNGKLTDDLLQIVTQTMKRLNKTASEIMKQFGATACTDVTGYGLMGHLHEMTSGSNVSARLFAEKIPLLPGVRENYKRKNIPGGLRDNRKYLEKFARISENADSLVVDVLFDPQTSGGLLIALPREKAASCLSALHDAGETESEIIGEFTERKGFDIEVV